MKYSMPIVQQIRISEHRQNIKSQAICKMPVIFLIALLNSPPFDTLQG